MRYLVLYLEQVFIAYLYAITMLLPALIIFCCLGGWFDQHTDWKNRGFLGRVMAASFVLLAFMPGMFLTPFLEKLINGWIGWE